MIRNELTIHTNTPGSEIVGGVLSAAGVTTFVTEDFNDLKAVIDEKSIPFDYIEDALLEDPGEVRVRVYLSPDEEGKRQEALIRSGVETLRRTAEFDLGALTVTVKTVDDRDWADNWKEYFHPLPVGNRFVVKPTWEPYEPDGSGRLIIEIDPASAFGTGRHETTALCLEALEDEPLAGKSLLDMGCGSGILGIGAALLGAKEVTAVDIEPDAVRATRENAAGNRIADGVLRAFCGNVLDDVSLRDEVMKPEAYDCIAANIVADVILSMLPLFRRCLKSGGVLVCSGILACRKEAVKRGLAENGFDLTEEREKNDWAVLKARKNP